MTGLVTIRVALRLVTTLASLTLLAVASPQCLLVAWSAPPIPAGDAPACAVAFDEHFVTQTMRVDYYHSGNADEDRIAVERIIRDGVWAGSRTRLTDPLDLGLYGFEVRDQQSQQLLYAQRFCSVFGEWQTTAPARQHWGTFHASLRFPWPRQPVEVTLKQRHGGTWRTLWTTTIDPHSRFVINADPPVQHPVWTVLENGPVEQKVDLLLLADGYTAGEMEKFHADAQRMTDRLFTVEPFQSRRADFNVRAIDVPSSQSGVAQPRDGVFHRSALGCQYNTFDLERYVLTCDNRTLRDVASAAPYDYLVILLNNSKYGGGGIYNDQTTVAVDCPAADYILVHELGHHLAGLGDEYYVSQVAYETGKRPRFEPWEPNITALLDGHALKWGDLVSPGTPIPTPWAKEAFETAARAQQRQAPKPVQTASGEDDAQSPAVAREPQRATAEILQASPYAGRIGAFEGASYEAHGLYRPAIDCIMFSRNPAGFCAVCQRAIAQAIDQHTAVSIADR
ncbi:MAG: peptidase M64 [Planctomycetaceae bacterium]|nr:peptidase M64 [Planctomycetaceae bacterium]